MDKPTRITSSNFLNLIDLIIYTYEKRYGQSDAHIYFNSSVQSILTHNILRNLHVLSLSVSELIFMKIPDKNVYNYIKFQIVMMIISTHINALNRKVVTQFMCFNQQSCNPKLISFIKQKNFPPYSHPSITDKRPKITTFTIL